MDTLCKERERKKICFKIQKDFIKCLSSFGLNGRPAAHLKVVFVSSGKYQIS